MLDRGVDFVLDYNLPVELKRLIELTFAGVFVEPARGLMFFVEGRREIPFFRPTLSFSRGRSY